ncbi:hypothetical protein, partial [Staphylococcus aureus]
MIRIQDNTIRDGMQQSNVRKSLFINVNVNIKMYINDCIRMYK